MKFISYGWIRGVYVLCLMCLFLPSANGQDDLRSAVKLRGQAVERMVNESGNGTLKRFIVDHLSLEFRQKFSTEELFDQLRRIRSRCANAGGIMWESQGDNGLLITFETEEGRSTALHIHVQKDPPHLIEEMDLKDAVETDQEPEPLAPVTWDSLKQRLEDEEKAGFSGVVLVVRDEKIVLHEGYGMSDLERGIPNSKKTIFAIGSTPIDFTKAAVLKLVDLGKLGLLDPITRFLSDVPKDKRSITIEHLMTGRSGLPNFHHIPGVDADYDLTWIDRETALERILGQTLLFIPGEGKAHSHSAWGLLAAIVEIVSGKSYKDFLDEHFFIPAGMDRTGLYQDASRFKEEEVAVGYSSMKAGKVNAPQYWGPTSWLVMGSGGMVSNPGDLYKWIKALRKGELLSKEALENYWSQGVLAGGNDRGFLCIYTEGPGPLMILCSNAFASMKDRPSQLARELVRLVMPDKADTR
ncbi:MAG: beta-lactamase family protein [Candidatus Aminicenantes bacterium]|nr:beta-lactamase family protein [Candidatus Aminicenantes bacterium]